MIRFNELIDKLPQILQKELPGEEAQYKMAPVERPLKEEAMQKAPKPKPGAVLVLIYPRNEEPHIVLMLRNTYLGVHSGQVSFPGGRREKEDATLVDTALREAEEEIGVEKEKVKIIGQLSEVYIPPSGYLVNPVVGFSEKPLSFKPDPREVKKIIEFPVMKLLEVSIVKTTDIFIKSRNQEIKAPYFDINGHVVWGATAMMLSELKEILKKCN